MRGNIMSRRKEVTCVGKRTKFFAVAVLLGAVLLVLHVHVSWAKASVTPNAILCTNWYAIGACCIEYPDGSIYCCTLYERQCYDDYNDRTYYEYDCDSPCWWEAIVLNH